MAPVPKENKKWPAVVLVGYWQERLELVRSPRSFSSHSSGCKTPSAADGVRALVPCPPSRLATSASATLFIPWPVPAVVDVDRLDGVSLLIQGAFVLHLQTALSFKLRPSRRI